MSNATWQIVLKRESVSKRDFVSKQKFICRQERFELLVTVESEHRPGTVYRWRGEIEIDESGGQHLKDMFLDNAENSDNADKGAALPKLAVQTWITQEDDPTDAFENIARACDEYTQEMERALVERNEKEERDREKISATTLFLKQMAAEGVHPGTSHR